MQQTKNWEKEKHAFMNAKAPHIKRVKELFVQDESDRKVPNGYALSYSSATQQMHKKKQQYCNELRHMADAVLDLSDTPVPTGLAVSTCGASELASCSLPVAAASSVSRAMSGGITTSGSSSSSSAHPKSRIKLGYFIRR